MREADETFGRYRMYQSAEIHQYDRGARRMYISDMRARGMWPFPEMSQFAQLLAHFTPQLGKPRANANDPPFEVDCIRGKLRNYTADLSGLVEFLEKNQLMANYISRELDRGKLQVPRNTPLLGPGRVRDALALADGGTYCFSSPPRAG